MEVFEFLPGALAAGWMLVRIVIQVRNGTPADPDKQNI
jgi:hypothetical protein